jgi:hypothetical protein
MFNKRRKYLEQLRFSTMTAPEAAGAASVKCHGFHCASEVGVMAEEGMRSLK